MAQIIPTSQAPDLSVELINGQSWNINIQSPETFSMIVFYRGYHCPKCQEQLEELQSKLPLLAALGANVLAISMDDKDLADKTYNEWSIKDVPLGYGLDEKTARSWGLFLSEKENKDIFCEPGLFLVKPDGTLYSSSIQTMPFARPHIEDVVDAIKFIKHKDYPAGGSIK